MAESSKYQEVGDYIINMDLAKCLGSTQKVSVHPGKHKITNTHVAAKRFVWDKDLPTDIVDQEVETMRSTPPHHNVLKLLDYVKIEAGKFKEIWLILELCPLGHLGEFAKNKELTLPQKVDLMLQSAQGVHHLHHLEKPLIHRDLKPANLLLTGDPNHPLVKVADYGESRYFQGSHEHSLRSMTAAGTPYYQAPELFGDSKSNRPAHNKAVDTYALGVSFLNLLDAEKGVTSTPITVGNKVLGLHLHENPDTDVCELVMKPGDSDEVKQVKNLICQMLVKDPTRRILIKDVVNNLSELRTSLGVKVLLAVDTVWEKPVFHLDTELLASIRANILQQSPVTTDPPKSPVTIDPPKSPKKSKLRPDLPKSPVKTEAPKSPVKTVPKKSKVRTDLTKSSVTTDPPKSPVTTVPKKSKLRIDPTESPVNTDLPKSPVTTVPKMSPVTKGPKTSPVKTDPPKSPLRPDPQRSSITEPEESSVTTDARQSPIPTDSPITNITMRMEHAERVISDAQDVLDQLTQLHVEGDIENRLLAVDVCVNRGVWMHEDTKWERVNGVPAECPKYGVCMCPVSDGFIACGGRARLLAPPASQCHHFSVLTRQWRKLANMLTSRSAASAVQYDDMKVLVVGGQDSDGESAVCEILDCENDQWTSAANMPEPLANPLIAVEASRAFMLPRDDNIVKPRLLRYDPPSIKHTYRSKLPRNVTNTRGACLVAASHKLYLLGGEQGLALEYNLDTDQWNQLTPPSLRYYWLYGCCAAVTPGMIELYGGSTEGQSVCNMVEVYDTHTQKWEKLDMRLPFSYHFSDSLVAHVTM